MGPCAHAQPPPLIDYHGITPTALPFDSTAGFSVGLLESLAVASITGVGADVMVNMVLVLLCHADLKIAIPTSVILMAFTSVVGIGTKLLTGTVQSGTCENWLAAAPVPATLEHKMELFRSSGKIFRDDNELLSEPSWIAVMLGQGIVPQAHHPFADQPYDAEPQALMARVRAGIARLAAGQPRHADYIDRGCRIAAGYQAQAHGASPPGPGISRRAALARPRPAELRWRAGRARAAPRCAGR